MRTFSYITVGRILNESRDELRQEIKERLKKEKRKSEVVRLRELLDKEDHLFPVTRPTFYRIEKKFDVPAPREEDSSLTSPWRKYTREQADAMKKQIKEYIKL